MVAIANTTDAVDYRILMAKMEWLKELAAISKR